MAKPRQTDLRREADRVLLGRPERVGGHRVLDAKPVPAGRRVARPVEARMIGQDLDAGADDEDQQEQIEEVLQPQPGRETRRRFGVRRLDGPGIPRDEVLNRRLAAQSLRDGDRDDQKQEADRQQPEQVEPPGAADTYARRDAVHLRDRARPGRRIDHVLARCELPAVAANDVRRNARLRRCGQILGSWVGVVSQSLESTKTPRSTSVAFAGRSPRCRRSRLVRAVCGALPFATGCDRLAPLMLHPAARIADVERLRRTPRARDLRMIRSLQGESQTGRRL